MEDQKEANKKETIETKSKMKNSSVDSDKMMEQNNNSLFE